jgi:2'-5' RNA ligase
MPHAGKFKVKKNFMSKCMRTTKSEGKKKDQSIAQCLNMWRDKHRGKDAATDYSKYLMFTPGDYGGQYYVLRIPEGITPPKEGDNLNLNGSAVVVSSVNSPEDIAKGRGGPVARSMRESGIAWDVNCLPKGHERLKDMNFSQKNASLIIDKIANNLQKTMEQADKSDKPTVFLGGSCQDNKWREELKKDFKDKLFFIDPYDPDWDPEENIYQELAAIINADHTVFYDGGEGLDKEMKFLDNTDRDYEEFDDIEKLKGYLNRLAEPVVKKACISERLRTAARILEAHEKYGFIGIRVPSDIANKVKALGKEIPDNEILESEGGLEKDTHITLVWGLTFKDPNVVKDYFDNVEPFFVTLNKTSMFIDNPKCDVLKIGVNSPALQDLHEKLREKYNPVKERENYLPHVTVGYLKKGYAEKYLDKDFSDCSFYVNSVYFSYDDKNTTIKFGKK